MQANYFLLNMKLSHATIIIFLILLLDQASKIYIKTHFMIDQSIHIFDWFHIRFAENPGAAWGMGIPGKLWKACPNSFQNSSHNRNWLLVVGLCKEKILKDFNYFNSSYFCWSSRKYY